MRIICTSTFLFRFKDECIKVDALEIADVPAWVKNDHTFKVGVEAGEIKLMDGKAETKAVENIQNGLSGSDREKSEGLAKGLNGVDLAEAGKKVEADLLNPDDISTDPAGIGNGVTITPTPLKVEDAPATPAVAPVVAKAPTAKAKTVAKPRAKATAKAKK